MRENLAQAMCHAYGYDWDVLKESDDKISIRSRAGWRALADAALATLETPDEGMVEAAAKVFGSHFAGAETARATFVAMIQHARKAHS